MNQYRTNRAVWITRVKKNHLVVGLDIFETIANNLDIIHVVVNVWIMDSNIISWRSCMNCEKVVVRNR